MLALKQAAGQLFLGSLLTFCFMGVAESAVRPDAHASVEAVEQLMRTIAGDLHDRHDRAAVQQLIAVFTERGIVSADQAGPWVLLTFNRAGNLQAVAVNAARFLSAPPLIQHAVILHEVEHLKSARGTRRALDGASRQQPFQAIVRTLVEDECRAYRREIGHFDRVVRASGGLRAYLVTLPAAERVPIQQYYQRQVQPVVTQDGRIDEGRLRDLVFFGTFPKRYRRYYEAALAWEALQGHVEIRRGHDGTLYPTHLLVPAAFLAWLLP